MTTKKRTKMSAPEIVRLLANYTKRERADRNLGEDDMVRDWLTLCEQSKAWVRRQTPRRAR